MLKGFSGKKHSEETKSKISIAKSGANNQYFGKHLSEEHKRKIGEANTKKSSTFSERRFSEETKAKMSASKSGANNPFFGKHLSDEHKKKISDANKGMVVSEETRKKCQIVEKVRH